MSDKLDFSLPKNKIKIPPVTLTILILVSALVLISGANLFVSFVLPRGGSGSAFSGLPAGQVKDLALKFQKDGLLDSAADAWNAYAAIAPLSAPDKANILYTVGTIRQEAGEYEAALAGFYRSEAVFKDKKLEQELSRRVGECLESLGKFAALRSELSDRVNADTNVKPDEVVAQIGQDKITKTDLDRKIEEYIGNVLSQNASYLGPDDQNKLKEELFKNYSGDDGRMKMLNQYIVEELLYRKAREEKIAEIPATRMLLKDMERKMLAQSYVNTKVGDQVKLTESDLSTYYETNKAKYIKDGKQKNFDEVRQDVYADLRKQKQSELEQQLIEDLRKQYNVVVYPSKIKGSGQEKK
jgi:hypothetical protein